MTMLGGIALAQFLFLLSMPIATHFLVSAVSPSVVCYIRAACLNCSTDLDVILHVHSQCLMTHCVNWVESLCPQGKSI